MRVLVWLGWVLVAFTAAGAADQVIPAPLQTDNDAEARADVYIDDSLEAHDKIERARRLARRERWSEAAALLEDASATAGDKLVQTGPLSYVGIQEYVADLVCRWPPMGIDAYRALVEDDAISALQDAVESDRLESWVGLFDRYFCTATAAELADRIGQKAIEVGELALAERHYRRVLERHPDAQRYAERYRAMVMLLQAMQGDAHTPEPEDANLPARWMGEDRTIGSVWPEVVAAFSNAHSDGPSSDWPIFGGSPARNRAASSRIDELGLLWRFSGFLASPRDSDEEGDTISRYRRRESARRLSIHPVTVGDLIFVQHYREILALHRNTGTIAWKYRPDETNPDPPSDLDDQPPGWDAVTVYGGRVYAALSGEVVPYYGYESAQHPPELVCLDARSGRTVWRTNHEKVGDAFAEVSFDSSPVVHGKSLYVVGRRRRSFGFEDCYLFRFHVEDGSFESRTHLGSASTGTFGARRATMAIAALQGDTLYVCSNLGTIAAISAHTGNVRWLRVYSRDRTDDLREVTWTVREVKPWAFNPVLCENGKVFCLPIDSPELLVLAEEDGRILHSIPKTDLAGIETVYGVRDGLLCGFGKEAFCYDLSTGAIRWQAPLASGGEVFGRGVWTDDRLLVPTREGLSTFRISDGRRSDRPWDTNGTPGNLRALPGQLLVSGDGVVSAYVRKADIWSSLRARMAEAPTDPLPALELAEVALQGGELDEAIDVLDEAVRRAGGLLEPPEPTLRKRFFDDVFAFVEVFQKRAALRADLLDRFVAMASQCAQGAEANLKYRLFFGKLYETFEKPERALRLYQQILRDRTLRDRHVPRESVGSGFGGTLAQARIAAVLDRFGREPFAEYETEARRWLEGGKTAADERALQRVVDVFPNSDAAPTAMTALGDVQLSMSRPAEAASTFGRVYHRYPAQVDRPALIKKIADAYEQAKRPEHAYRWLTKGAREFPGARIEHEGRRVSFLIYRDRLIGVREKVEPRRPRIGLPLDRQFSLALASGDRLLTPRFSQAPHADWSRYFVYGDDGVRAFESTNTKDLWSRPAPVRIPPALLFAGKEVIVLATTFEVFGLDATTGRRLWTHGEYPPDFDAGLGDWEDERGFRVHAMDAGRLINVREDGLMTCVSIDNGREIWSKTISPMPLSGVHMAGPWVAYHVNHDGTTAIVVTDAATGERHSIVTTDEPRPVDWFSTTVDAQLIVVTSRSIAAYDIDNASRRWRVALDGYVRSSTLTMGLDALFLSDDGRSIRKISFEDGRTMWVSEELVGRGEEDLSVQRMDGHLLLSTASSISVIDDVTGMTLWRGTTPDLGRLIERSVSQFYVVAFDIAGENRDEPSTAYFYDHRNASGMIPKVGGACRLGDLKDIRAILVADDALLIQTGSTIRGWTTK